MGDSAHWLDGRPYRHVHDYGETYVVNCPNCGDTRKRLDINHRWGAWDAETESNNLHLIKCFNEDCFADRAARKYLYWALPASGGRRPKIVLDSAPSTAPSSTLWQVDPPGRLIRIDRLAVQEPDHPAIWYLRDRDFDPVILGKRYRVSYCPESKHRLAEGRIIIPVYRNQLLVGWQARYIGDPNFKSIKQPKYWSCPGMKRSRLAYNFDTAITYPTVVLVEGPIDVWGFGPQAIALFGKTMSVELRRELLHEARKRKFSVVILLDPEQHAKEEAKGRPHHIEVLYEQLKRSAVLRKRLVKVYLPTGRDPGSMVLERKLMRSLIAEEAAKAGVKISFKVPSNVESSGR